MFICIIINIHTDANGQIDCCQTEGLKLGEAVGDEPGNECNPRGRDCSDFGFATEFHSHGDT